jgi:hypothetical protein
LFNSESPEKKKDAIELFYKVDSGEIKGIYGDDLGIAAKLAAKRGTVRWKLVPPGQDAVWLEDELPDTPVIIFKEAAGRKPRLDNALLNVYRENRGGLTPITPALCVFPLGVLNGPHHEPFNTDTHAGMLIDITVLPSTGKPADIQGVLVREQVSESFDHTGSLADAPPIASRTNDEFQPAANVPPDRHEILKAFAIDRAINHGENGSFSLHQLDVFMHPLCGVTIPTVIPESGHRIEMIITRGAFGRVELTVMKSAEDCTVNGFTSKAGPSYTHIDTILVQEAAQTMLGCTNDQADELQYLFQFAKEQVEESIRRLFVYIFLGQKKWVDPVVKAQIKKHFADIDVRDLLEGFHRVNDELSKKHELICDNETRQKHGKKYNKRPICDGRTTSAAPEMTPGGRIVFCPEFWSQPDPGGTRTPMDPSRKCEYKAATIIHEAAHNVFVRGHNPGEGGTITNDMPPTDRISNAFSYGFFAYEVTTNLKCAK